MSDAKITATEISDWLQKQGKKAVWLAKTMGVTPATVSRWLNEKVIPSGSDESLLRLLIRGEMPFDIANEKTLHGVLDFSPDQWKVISILATGEGKTPGKWIAERIRWILAGDEKTRKIMKELASKRTLGNANIELLDPPDENRAQAGNS